MALSLGLTVVIDAILISQGLGQYSTLGMIFGTDFKKQKKDELTVEGQAEKARAADERYWQWWDSLSQEQRDEIELAKAKEEERKVINDFGKLEMNAYKKQKKNAGKDLMNRKVAIAALPTTESLKRADTVRKGLLANTSPITGAPVAGTLPSVDNLAVTRQALQKLNDDAILRTNRSSIRLKEAMEDAEENEAKAAARQEQIEGQRNLMAQRKEVLEGDLGKMQETTQQNRDVISKYQTDIAAANEAVIKAEQEQRAKAVSLATPRRGRLPPSIKRGGSMKNTLLKRLMSETDMSKAEAMRYIKLHGI